jgi:hypothetical protein
MNETLSPSRDDGRIEALQAQIARLRSRVATLEAVVDAVQKAAIRDHNIYSEIPDEDWLAIDRDGVTRILSALAAVDRWRPWTTVLERRLGDV